MRTNYIELLIYVVRSGVAFLKLSQLCLHVVPKTGIFEGPSIEKEEDNKRPKKRTGKAPHHAYGALESMSMHVLAIQ